MALALPSGSEDCGLVRIGCRRGGLPLLGPECLPSSQSPTLSTQPGQPGWAVHPHPHPGRCFEWPSSQGFMTARAPWTHEPQGEVADGDLDTWVVARTCQSSDLTPARPHSVATRQHLQA